MNLTLSHRATPSEGVMFRDAGGEAVLLNLASERFFGLDPVAARGRNMLVHNTRLKSANQLLCAEFEVEPERLASGMIGMVRQSADAGWVEVD